MRTRPLGFPFEARCKLQRWGRQLALRRAWRFGPGELESAVDLAVVEAWRRFRPDRGAAFATYARSWVRGAVVAAVLERARAWASLARRGQMAEPIAPDPNAEVIATVRHVTPALAVLTDLDRAILVSHVVHDEPLPRIAEQLGLSRTAVWRRFDVARTRLRWVLTGGGAVAGPTAGAKVSRRAAGRRRPTVPRGAPPRPSVQTGRGGG